MKSEYADHASDYLDSFAMTGYACSDNFERLRRCEIIAENTGDGSTDCHELDISHPLNIFAIASMSKADRMKANREALLLQLLMKKSRILTWKHLNSVGKRFV